jgi:tRNA U34 2-thiouridine synthase MnmA/TrmU
MKSICVFSGGLDSMLAAELIRAQDIDVVAFFFETPFFSSEKARRYARCMDLPIKVLNITDRHLKIVKSPRHGHGENMNPCIDCHALMIRVAGEHLEKEGADFLITGEVLGQRPMSQNRKALSIVSAESGMDGLLLRPLSAKRLPLSIPEKEGWVDREKLMGLSGRSRKPQMALATKLGITDYPSPGGGCLLTDIGFSRRLRDLLAHEPFPPVRDLELLKFGRHFRIDQDLKLVVGRNKKENQVMQEISKPGDMRMKTLSVPGPVVMIRGELSPETERLAAILTATYSDAKDREEIDIVLLGNGHEKMIKAGGRKKEAFKAAII